MDNLKRFARYYPNEPIRVVEEQRGRTKRLMKVFSGDSAMWRGWKMTDGLCRGVCR